MTTHAFNPIFRHFSSLVLSAFLYVGFSAAEAKDLWVDILSLGGACSDARNRDQVGPATPWCNLGPAGEQALAGDTVTVRRGTYSKAQTCPECFNNFVLQVLNSGTSSAWIKFRSLPGEKVVISGEGGVAHGIGVNYTRWSNTPRFVSVEGFEVRDFGPEGFCTWVRSTSDVVLRDLDVHGCSLGAVELHDTARVTVEDSRIHDNPMSGWTSAVDLYRCREGHIIRRNHIWGNTDTNSAESEGHGVIMDVCRDYGGSAVIESNVIWENEGWCIAINWADNSVIRNNTCWMNGNGRAETGEISVGNDNHRVHNNITVPRPGRLGLNMKYGAGNTFEYNLVQGGNTWPHNLYSISDDPMLVNPGTGDFYLKPGSPAIDSGDNSNAAATDADGTARPQDGSGLGYAIVDLGAYEYVQDNTDGGSTGGGSTGGGDSSSSPTAPTLLSADLAGDLYELTWSTPNTPDGGYDIVIDGVDTNSQYRTSGLQASIDGLDTEVEHCFRIQSRYVELRVFPASEELCAQPISSDPGTGGSGGGGSGGATSEFIVDFDAPTPPGSSNSLLSGVFEGIDFGQGQWRWEGAWSANPSNHIFFDSSSGLSRNFQFARSPAILTGMRVTAGASGVLTLTDDAGQTFTKSLSAGRLIMIETGWTQTAKTVTVNYSAGWELAVDDVTYVTE